MILEHISLTPSANSGTSRGTTIIKTDKPSLYNIMRVDKILLYDKPSVKSSTSNFIHLQSHRYLLPQDLWRVPLAATACYQIPVWPGSSPTVSC